jgi:hypothetical protein
MEKVLEAINGQHRRQTPQGDVVEAGPRGRH